MILVTRPFLTGHYIQIGEEAGMVRAINLFNTELASLEIIVPNKQLWESTLKNYSAHERRRLDMVIGVDYSSDLDQAVAIIRRLVDADPRAALREPEPFVKVTELGQSSVDITLRVWCQADQLFDMKFDLTKRIKERFDQAGIAIPYPHVEVVHKETPGPARGVPPVCRARRIIIERPGQAPTMKSPRAASTLRPFLNVRSEAVVHALGVQS